MLGPLQTTILGHDLVGSFTETGKLRPWDDSTGFENADAAYAVDVGEAFSLPGSFVSTSAFAFMRAPRAVLASSYLNENQEGLAKLRLAGDRAQIVSVKMLVRYRDLGNSPTEVWGRILHPKFPGRSEQFMAVTRGIPTPDETQSLYIVLGEQTGLEWAARDVLGAGFRFDFSCPSEPYPMIGFAGLEVDFRATPQPTAGNAFPDPRLKAFLEFDPALGWEDATATMNWTFDPQFHPNQTYIGPPAFIYRPQLLWNRWLRQTLLRIGVQCLPDWEISEKSRLAFEASHGYSDASFEIESATSLPVETGILTWTIPWPRAGTPKSFQSFGFIEARNRVTGETAKLQWDHLSMEIKPGLWDRGFDE